MGMRHFCSKDVKNTRMSKILKFALSEFLRLSEPLKKLWYLVYIVIVEVKTTARASKLLVTASMCVALCWAPASGTASTLALSGWSQIAWGVPPYHSAAELGDGGGPGGQ